VNGAERMNRPIRMTIAVLAAATLPALPAAAQFSDSYKFLKAVRDADGDKATEALASTANVIVNTRDYTTGETALHIVVKRRDMTWLGFLISKGAKPDARDAQGNTPLMIAAQIGFEEGVQVLLGQRASVDLENNKGETPLIAAVHNRDLPMVRLLLSLGANPLRTDRIAGKSAKDYATEDPRAVAILKQLNEAKPAKPSSKMSGPTL
jgi:ankyrin repeat protein